MSIVLAALVILIFGLTPSLVSIWIMRHADARAQARLRLAVNTAAVRRISGFSSLPDQHYIQGFGYIVGDITCRFNARSSYIRCAVNPMGPCPSCSHYDPTDPAPTAIPPNRSADAGRHGFSP